MTIIPINIMLPETKRVIIFGIERATADEAGAGGLEAEWYEPVHVKPLTVAAIDRVEP
jgi:hypothetical protein